MEGRSPTRLRLRTRLTLAFGLGALFLSTLLAAVTYGLTRDNLIDRREADAREIAFRNANRVDLLLTDETDEDGVNEILSSRATVADGTSVLRVGANWFSADPVAFAAPDNINDKLLAALTTANGDTGDGDAGDGDAVGAARMRYRVDNTTFLVIGIPITSREGLYIEAVPLSDIEDTLSSLGLALLGAGAVTTAAGVGLGAWAARRVLAPLEEVSETAEALAAGDLSARLEVGGDRDLALLADSFNEMASNLEDRIERDARFASDVSHELRSPLMTIMASAEVLNSRADDLDDRSRTALELLTSDLERFRQLVADLLEISRFDTRAGNLETDYFGIVEFVSRVAQDSEHRHIPVSYPPEMATTVVAADKRRLARVIANLLENAASYGGGATGIELRQVGTLVEIAVEDEGPGVPADERQLIFARFARGSEGGRRGAGTGTGLGLALVAEHVRLHGGRVRVDDRPDGMQGARFVVELPIVADADDVPDHSSDESDLA